jgi:ParB family chromosome partitioning protein
MERKVLGKGLEALIPRKTAAILPKEFTHLSVSKIRPAKNQPRQEIGKKELDELAQSIKQKGFIQPIVVREIGQGQYEVVAGERRFQASKSLGLKEIPTIIKDLSEKEAFVLAIIENLQRKDLNPIEEAQAFKRLIDELHFSLEDIAQFVAKDKSTVVNTLRLLKLPDKIIRALKDGLISRSQARTILSADNTQTQEKLFYQILKGGISVRDLEKKVRATSRKKKTIDPFVLETEGSLQKILGTKVKIYNKRNNQGKIVIEYYTLNDFERIIKRFK